MKYLQSSPGLWEASQSVQWLVLGEILTEKQNISLSGDIETDGQTIFLE